VHDMQAIGHEDFRKFLSSAGIKAADPNTGIGNELSYVVIPPRTIEIHFAESDSAAYWRAVTDLIWELEDEWLVVPRYGSAGDLGLVTVNETAAAIRFGAKERERMSDYLCTRPMSLGSLSVDLYVISASGATLVTWDHHTADEGMAVEFSHIDTASRLLVSLNEIGTELGLYCAP
jgi:hypothetical protein